ncbi:hypothetical protein B5T_02596 [Alloalcanivorax dieselolei B5]|uniref:Uncharacterized protein n=1 Tax=Alcanivorax dieselolei (strain DSM 16502 / CGMCC 1.3690 / MCCC 1A00001 / B-5) TaxID=930169 RepID=K0CGX1_ALCDB|nr:hypothetical protein B5T_02596 [Alloalcanivorax dieselolei B5]
MNPRNLLNLKLFLLLVILAQFGFPLTVYGPFWEGLYMVFYAGMLVFGIAVARQREQPIWPNLILVIFVLIFAGGVVADPADPRLSLGMYLSIGLFLFSITLTLLKLIFQRRAADGTDMPVTLQEKETPECPASFVLHAVAIICPSTTPPNRPGWSCSTIWCSSPSSFRSAICSATIWIRRAFSRSWCCSRRCGGYGRTSLGI